MQSTPWCIEQTGEGRSNKNVGTFQILNYWQM